MRKKTYPNVESSCECCDSYRGSSRMLLVVCIVLLADLGFIHFYMWSEKTVCNERQIEVAQYHAVRDKRTILPPHHYSQSHNSPDSQHLTGRLDTFLLSSRPAPSSNISSRASSATARRASSILGPRPRKMLRKRKKSRNRGSKVEQLILPATLESGSTYIRWGRHTCPKDAKVVYTGYTAGSYPLRGFSSTADLYCLPSEPEFQDGTKAGEPSKNLLTAVLFSVDDNDVFPQDVNNGVVKCAVCLVNRTPSIMLPGSIVCPPGWVTEYTGYLMAAPGITNEYFSGSRAHCVDASPDFYGGHNDKLYPKINFLQAGHCHLDKAPCTDYTLSKKLSCAVCSKDVV